MLGTTMVIRRWKAFLRLQGETQAERDEDILNEFKGFVQALKRVGIDYSIVVNVEEGRQDGLIGRQRHEASMAHSPTHHKGTERVGG